MSTVRSIIKAALRKCGGVVAEGEEPSDELAQDTLAALGVMLDAWSIEKLMVYGQLEQVKTWTAGSATETLGPTGTISGVRPVSLLPSTYYTTGGGELSHQISLISREEYNSIGSKGITSDLPSLMLLSPDVPNSTIYLYPVPSADIEIHFFSLLALTLPGDIEEALPAALPFTFLLDTDLSDEFTLAPGYERALIYNLAIEIAPELGISPSATVQRLALVSKRSIKRINNAKDILSIPSMLARSSHYDINAG